MTMVTHLRRFAIALALLPQLLLLGLGQGVVLCVAPGGHMRVEAAESVCCAESTVVGAAQGGIITSSPDRANCDECVDYRISVDPRLAPSSNSDAFDLPLEAIAALPIATPQVSFGTSMPPYFGRAPDRGQAAPHLIHLRSVLLRC